MGNQLGTGRAPEQQLDFDALFVDGESWDDAQKHDSFLSKVQRCLLEPSFVSALQMDPGEEQRSVDSKEKAQVFDRMISAGAFDSHNLLALLKPRYQEALSSTLHTPPYAATLAKRVCLLRHLQEHVSSYRSAAQRPLVKQQRAPPPPSTEESSQVQLTYSMNRVCLVSLKAIVEWGKASGSMEYVRLPLKELQRMAMSFQPLCFFEHVSIPVCPPEAAVDLEPLSAFASSTDSNRTPDKALDDKSNSYWCSKKRPGAAHWGVRLGQPENMSAVTVSWQQTFSSVFAPAHVTVQVSHDGDTYVDVAKLDMEKLTLQQASAPVRIPASAERVMAVRLHMTGCARFNDQGCYALKSVAIHHVRASPEYLDIRDVIDQLLGWLVSVTDIPELYGTALTTIERVACASGLLSCVLQFVFCLLQPQIGRAEALAVEPMLVETTRHMLKCVEEEDAAAKRKMAQAVSSPMAPVVNAAFDPYEMSSTGLTLSDDNVHVRCHTASHSHVYLTCGFKEGRWAWEFLIAEDITNDESICIGAGIKPVTSSSYNSSPNLLMYRCYNGNLYRKGGQIAGVSKERVHPNDVVRVELDHDAHTLSVRINGDKDQGVCFTDVVGEVFPAVAFYGANRAVRLLAVECAGSAGPGVRYYLPTDPFKRKKWEGAMASGLRHGYGKLTYTHTASHWVGLWKQDKQHGLQAWVVVEPTTGKPNLAETVIYVFECDVKKRVATEKDVAAAVRDWDGWVCAGCSFVSRRASDLCVLCGAVKTVQQKAVEGEEKVDERLHSREACAAAIMTRLAQLGTLYNSAVGEGSDEMVGLGARSVASAKDATLPFVSEPRIEVFKLLHELIWRFEDLDNEEHSRLIIAGLRLIRTNFDRLVASHIDPRDMGIETISPGSDAPSPSPIDTPTTSRKELTGSLDLLSPPSPSRPSSSASDNPNTLYPLRESLERLMMATGSRAARDVGQAAAKALAAGMEILYPDAQIRCSLLCHLLRSHTELPCGGPSAAGQSILLDRLLKRFGTNDGVVALLPTIDRRLPPAKLAVDNDEQSKLLLEYLFRALHLEKSRELDDLVHLRSGRLFHSGATPPVAAGLAARKLRGQTVDGDDGKTGFAESTSVLLGAYLRQLLSTAGASVPSYGGDAGCPPMGSVEDALSGPEARMLVAFGLMLLKHCQKLLWTVSNHISSGSLSTSQAEAFLQSTVLFQLLPLFATASSLLSDQLWFASKLVPHIVRVIRSLDEFNGMLPEVLEAEKELRLQERAMTHGRWVSKKRNEVPNAAFDTREHSEDVSIEDNGKLFRSTSSSNQHALVNVGFKTGKAAWEFKLEADSSNDECSALGAAVKPLLNSCYESCPNMWMRRSYNGQLYHGTSAGYGAMTKVHPGDVVRVEVDLDAHTMSFKKNGEDEGVAFTDIEGEVFPAVCTYRSGIEVRLLQVEYWEGTGGTGMHTQSPLSLSFDSCFSPSYVRVDEYDNSVAHVDKERDEKWATAVAVRGLSSCRHVWEFCIRRCSKAMIAVGVCTNPNAAVAEYQLGMQRGSWAWRVDGTLWAHGRLVSASYGTIKTQHLLTDGDVITVTLDVQAQTLAFAVNGRDLGLAFGPPGSGAESEVPVAAVDAVTRRAFFPAVALHNYNDRVRMRPSGTMGTLALPWLLDLESTLMSVGSRLSATVTAGPCFSQDELKLGKWLKSPLFSLGLEQKSQVETQACSMSARSDRTMSLLAEGGGEGGADDLDESKSSESDILESLSLLEGWDLIGEDERVLGSPDKRRRVGVVKTMSPLHSVDSDDDGVFDDFQTSLQGDSRRDMNRFFQSILPAPPIGGGVGFDDDAPFTPSRELQLLHKWVDPHGSGRLTRRLTQSYPIVAFCEAYCLAAMLKVTGLWVEAARVIEQSGEKGRPAPAVSSEARTVGKKLQELRMGLVKRHQKMKEEQHEGDGFGLGEPRGPPSLHHADSFGLLSRQNSTASLTDTSAEPVMREGASLSFSNTAELEFSQGAALMDGDRSGYNSGVRTPTVDDMRALELRRRVSVGPHVLGFLQVCSHLLEKARFLLELNSAPGAVGGPQPPSPEDAPSLSEQVLQAAGDFLLDRSTVSVSQLRAVFSRRLARAMCRRYGLRCFRALVSASTHSSVQVHAVMHLKSALSAELLLGSGRQDIGGGSGDGSSQDKGVLAVHGHHYMKGLEGCQPSTVKKVQQDFAALYRFLLTLLKRALTDKNVTLACCVLAAWALDFEPADAKFLSEAKILSSLRSLLSLSRLSRCISAGIVITDTQGLHWGAWPIDDVRTGLAQGRITKRIVMEHMRSAPMRVLPRSWWLRFGLTPEATADLDVVTARLRIGDVVMLYESMLKSVSEVRQREKTRAAEADRRAREEVRRKKGIKYTYIVTATNGVGVRQLPDTRAERTGHSYKQHEVVEASYRLTLSNRQTYIKLVEGGWVFDVGVRGSYQNKPIMRCIATEDFVAETEAEREARAAAGRLLPIARAFKLADEPYEIIADGTTIYYKDPNGEHVAVVRTTTSFPRSAPLPQPTIGPFGRKPMLSSHTASSYYEVIIHSVGARREICIGLWDGDKDDTVDGPIGEAPHTYGLHLKDWAIWTRGERLFCGKDRLLEGPSRNTAARSWQGVRAVVLGSRSRDAGHSDRDLEESRLPDAALRELLDKVERCRVEDRREEKVVAAALPDVQHTVLATATSLTASYQSSRASSQEEPLSEQVEEEVTGGQSPEAVSPDRQRQAQRRQSADVWGEEGQVEVKQGIDAAEAVDVWFEAEGLPATLADLFIEDSEADAKPSRSGNGSRQKKHRHGRASPAEAVDTQRRSPLRNRRWEVAAEAKEDVKLEVSRSREMSPTVATVASSHEDGVRDVEDPLELFTPVRDGDVVGVGVDHAKQQIFFTRNGRRLRATIEVNMAQERDLVPIISLRSHCEVVEVNMGPKFLYTGREVQREVKMSVQIPPPLSTCLPPPHSTRSRTRDGSSTPRTHHLGLRLPSPLPIQPSTLFAPFSPTMSEVTQRSELTQRSSLWRQQPALSPRLTERHTPFEHSTKDDEDLTSSKENDFAYALSVPEMDALHGTAWPLFQLLLVQGVEFSLIKPAVGSAADINSSVSSRGSDRASPFRSMLDAMDPTRAARHLYHSSLDLVIEQLKLCADVLMGHRAPEDPSTCGGVEPLKVEALAFRYLLQLYTLADHLPLQEHTKPTRFLCCLLALLVCGSPRIQRLSLRVLRATLTYTQPSVVDEALTKSFRQQGYGTPPIFLKWMLDRMSVSLGRATGMSPSETGESAYAVPFKRGAFASSTGCSAGHAHLALVCEEACLLRALWSHPVWHDEITGTITSAFRRGAEAMRQTHDRPERTREVLSTLAALFVLSDMDMVRVGGILERRATGDRSVTSQYAVVEYKRGACAVNVVDLVSKDQPLSAATDTPISLPVSSIASGEVMPVPEVSTPRLSDDACRALLQQLLQLAISCGRAPSPLHCDRKDLVVWSRVRTLTVCGLRTLLAQFRFTWSEPQLVPQISKLLFDLALAPVPLPSCPPTSRIESKLQVLQERMYECASQGHALLSCPEPSHLASALRLEGEEDTRLYRVVLREGAVVRSGISIDSSDRVKVLKMGTVVEVLEQCAAPPEGITRLRIAEGWISERCHGGSEELIVERVSKALVDSMPPQGPHAPPLPFDLEALRDKNIRHKLHDGPLRLSLQPCPDGGVWDCDHCSVNFFNNEAAFTAALPTRTYSLCIPCFCSDPKAVSYARSRSRTASTEPSDAASPKSEPSRDVHSSMPPRLDVADDKLTPSGPMTPAGASRISDSHVTSLAVMQLSEMGFREDDARRALHSALPASGALTMEGLEPVLQQAIEFLTSGTLPPVIVHADDDDEPPPLDHDLAEEQDGTDEGYDDDMSRPLLLPQLDHDVPYSVAESKDDDVFGGGGSPYRRIHPHSPVHDHGYAWKKPPVEEMGADPAVPGSWDVRDTSKAEKVHRLSRATGCPRSVCRCALELCAGDWDAALRWIEMHGMHYLPDQGRETSFYPSVFVSLGFRGNVVRGGSGELGIAGTDDVAVPHDAVHLEHENGEDGTAVMHKLSARMGSEGEETLLYEGASAKAPGDGWDRCEERELAFEEAILENMEVERTSRLHKVIVALVCTRCRYLEFPGCSQHSQLLSVRKPNGHGKCARCSCATDLHSPWDKGCRVCRKPTMKYFWAITIRETQMLLRAFPSQSRTAYDDTCETYVQHCPECNVVGFAGLPGQTPVLCTRTKAGLYTPGAFHPTCTNESLSPETWYPHLSHVGSCSRAGQPVDPVLVRVSFSEAKYLYKTAANVDTYARYVVRARGVGDGTLVAVTEDEGPVDMLLGRLGTIRTVPPLAAAAVMSSEDVVEDGEQERPVGAEITVEMFDGERGFAVPEAVPTSHARIVTHMYGHELQADTALGTLQHLAAETDGMVATRHAREALVLMMSHWPPQHPPTLPALGLKTWQPFIHLFKLVGLTERAFEPSVAGPESGACSSLFPGAEAVHASTLAERASAPGAMGTAAPSCVRPASLAGTLKRQVALWLRSMSQYQDTTLFRALLADSLHNLHSMALGQALSPSLSPNVLQCTDNTASYPAPASLRQAGRSMSYVHEPSAISGPTVRQSLHPYFAPAAYGEEIRLSGAQSLRVTLDPRCAFGGERGGGADASLCFWRSEKAARSGAKPIKRWPAAGDARSTEAHGTAAIMSFVMPDTDRLFYTFTASDGQSRHLPRRLELEVTNFCREDVTVDDNNVVKCHAGFPTLTTKDVVLTSAKWYYEVHIIKAGLAQLGWGDALFTGNSLKGEGVGDDLHSWGLDGHRVYRWHGGGVKWGREWQDGDVIGFAADLDKRTFSFSFNGSWEAPMGLAFEEVTFVEGLRPCLTLNKSCNFRVNFGEEPFKYTPPTGHRGVSFAPREHVLRKNFWGYRFEVAPCLGIQTRFVSDFRPLWKSSNASHGPSSHSGDILSIWRPKVLPGCAMLGDVAVSGLVKPEITLLVVDDDSPLLAYPTGYTRVMTLDTRSTESSGCLWRPIPPEGFVAIGDVFSSGFNEPPLSLVRCLRQDALEPAPLYRRVRVWRETKGGVVSARDGPRQPSATLWAVGNQCHSFMIAEGYTTPMTDGFALRGWRIRGAMPGAMNQAWHAETEAQAQPSMDWALWVLHCFLENSTDTQLAAGKRSDPGTDLLRGGILTGHATYEALVRCVVDSHCTDRARSPAASLLTRLLRTRRTYAQLLSPQPGELPGSVRALGRVTKELFKFCRERVQSSTRLFLQRDLQQIIELIITINWVSPQTLAVHHGFVAGSPRGKTSHGPPSFMLPPRSARRALIPTPSVAPDAGHTHTHAHMHVKTTGPGKRLAQLKRAAKGERMSDAEAISDLMSLAEFFGESFGPLSPSTPANKAPHIPFCITTVRAWLETVGSSAVVESMHPWVGLNEQSGEIVLDGAEILEVIFDRRCNLGPSGVLTLIGQDANSDSTSTINWATGEGGRAWTGSSSDRGDFEARVIFRGPRLRWRVDVDAGGLETSTSEGPVWGYAFTAVGRTFTPGAKLRRVMKALENAEMTGSFARWSAEYDGAIVEWLNSQADVPGKDALGVSPFDFRHGPTDVSGAVTLQLETLPISAIYHRIMLIQGFNRAISQVLPLLDVSSGCRHSLGHKLRGLSYLIFRDIKINLIDAGKSKTQGGGGNALTITLDNFAASRSMEAEEKDIRASRCIFVQAFRALHHKDTKLLRSCWDGDRVFQVTFRGESGSDVGGVFREGMSRVVEDLFSDTINLLIPCPNAQHGLPTNVDKFLPNPKLSACPLALDMFEFVGKLMGISLRANLCLPFQFPSLVWKQLLGQELGVKDMESVDTLTCKLLESVRSCVSAEDFDEKYGNSLTFVCTGWDGSEMELFPGGASEYVVYDTRDQYCHLLLDYRLHEFDQQVAAMARGLFALVPRTTILLLTWREFEVLVCGTPSFDMEFWRRHTTYSGYTEEDVTIQLFWKVMQSLSQEEQSGFVRFAWGRSRLPPKHAWYKDMQISRRNTGDDSLPASHTCFFSIELPPYKTEAAMRKGLLTAIHFGMVGILNT